MANSIKQKSNSAKSKSIKIKDIDDVNKVITKNKNTVVTGSKSNAVRKKPVIKQKKEEPKKEEKKLVVKKDNAANIKTLKVADVENIKNKSNSVQAKEEERKATTLTEKKEETPVVDKKEVKQEAKNIPKKNIKMPKNRKLAKAASKTNKQLKSKKNLPPQEKNVKSVIKQEEPKREEKPIVIEKVEDNAEIKSIKVEKVDNIKKRAKQNKKEKQKKVTAQTGKRVKSVYDPNLNRWVVKEDKSKPKETPKSKKTVATVSPDNDYTYELESGGIKSKFFEEVDVDRYKEVRKTKRKKYPKRIIIALIIITIIGVTSFIFYKKYKQMIKEKLNMYPVYTLGQKVNLADDSTWYVVETSDGSKGLVTLLAEGLLETTGDDIPESFQYSSGKVDYDPLDESSIAYYLNNTYKTIIEEKVGKIEDVSLMSSKQYVGLRTGLGYGYEWSNDNILANKYTCNYFLSSSQNGKIYLVSPNGTYRMVDPTSTHLVRVVITIEKGLIKKD